MLNIKTGERKFRLKTAGNLQTERLSQSGIARPLRMSRSHQFFPQNVTGHQEMEAVRLRTLNGSKHTASEMSEFGKKNAFFQP